MQECLHHSSLSLCKSLDLDPTKMVVNVTIGGQEPGQVDTGAVAKQLPYGTVTVTAVKGGLNVPDEANGLLTVVAAAVVEARYDIPEGRFRLVG